MEVPQPGNCYGQVDSAVENVHRRATAHSRTKDCLSQIWKAEECIALGGGLQGKVPLCSA